jgi:hypothetical protein
MTQDRGVWRNPCAIFGLHTRHRNTSPAELLPDSWKVLCSMQVVRIRAVTYRNCTCEIRRALLLSWYIWNTIHSESALWICDIKLKATFLDYYLLCYSSDTSWTTDVRDGFLLYFRCTSELCGRSNGSVVSFLDDHGGMNFGNTVNLVQIWYITYLTTIYRVQELRSIKFNVIKL